MRYGSRFFRHCSALLGILCLLFFGGKSLPLLRPLGQSSLRTLALAAVCSSHPQRSIQLWKDEVLSVLDNEEQVLPIVEQFIEISPPDPLEKTPINKGELPLC